MNLSAQWDVDPVGTMVNILHYRDHQYESQLRYVAENHSDIFLSILDVIANETFQCLISAVLGTPVEAAVMSFYAETLINDVFAINFLEDNDQSIITRAWVYAPMDEDATQQKMILAIKQHLAKLKLNYKYPNPQMETIEDYYKHILWPLAQFSK